MDLEAVLSLLGGEAGFRRVELREHSLDVRERVPVRFEKGGVTGRELDDVTRARTDRLARVVFDAHHRRGQTIIEILEGLPPTEEERRLILSSNQSETLLVEYLAKASLPIIALERVREKKRFRSVFVI